MGNTLGIDLHEKVVVIREESHSPAYRALEHRVFRVDGGFGASAGTIGTALIGEYLFDGMRSRVEGYDVERLATDEDIAAVEAAKVADAAEEEDAGCTHIWVDTGYRHCFVCKVRMSDVVDKPEPARQPKQCECGAHWCYADHDENGDALRDAFAGEEK